MNPFPLPQETRLSQWKGYLELARISNTPTVVSNAAAGAALAGGSLWSVTFVLLAAAFAALYTAGMFLNDCCDYLADCRERPERPLPRGVVPRRMAFCWGLSLLGFGVGLLWLTSERAGILGLVLGGLVLLYSYFHKGNPYAPLLMGACRALVYLATFFAFSTAAGFSLFLSSVSIFLYVVGISVVSRLLPIGRGYLVEHLIAGICVLDAMVMIGAGVWPLIPFLSLLSVILLRRQFAGN